MMWQDADQFSKFALKPFFVVTQEAGDKGYFYQQSKSKIDSLSFNTVIDRSVVSLLLPHNDSEPRYAFML
jgi:hypothetical protein